jgi:hypothetical protein
MIKLKKIYDKLRLNDEIESKKKIYKSIKNKRIRTEIELTITKRIKL